MKHSVIPTVNVFIINGSKLLLGKRINTGWMDGYLCPPGGHIEVGETPINALKREIKEELGIDVDANDLEFACVAARNSTPPETVAYEFIVRDKSYKYVNAEPAKCSELIWVDLYNLPTNVITDFREIILKGIIANKAYLEIGY